MIRAPVLLLLLLLALLAAPAAARGESAAVSGIGVEITMAYDWRLPRGVAQVRWIAGEPVFGLPESRARIALAAFLYARILVVHGEARDALIRRTAPAARALAEGAARFAPADWMLQTDALSMPVYPWSLAESDEAVSGRTYRVSLAESSRQTLYGRLKRDEGLERLLLPAAPLILFTALAERLSAAERILLGRVITAVNQHYADLAPATSLVGSDHRLLNMVAAYLRERDRTPAAAPRLSRAAFVIRSGDIARRMGRLHGREMLCGLKSSLARDKVAGLFENYMTGDQQRATLRRYGEGLDGVAGEACDKAGVHTARVALADDLRAWLDLARPLRKEW